MMTTIENYERLMNEWELMLRWHFFASATIVIVFLFLLFFVIGGKLVCLVVTLIGTVFLCVFVIVSNTLKNDFARRVRKLCTKKKLGRSSSSNEDGRTIVTACT